MIKIKLKKKLCNYSFNCAEYLRAILKAPVYKIAKITPLNKMKKISSRFNNTILVKREDLQITHSFKLRGAYNMMSSLCYRNKIDGVITASAGNHAQGVALSARELGIKSIIVMPNTTSDIKVEAVKYFGGKIILFGNNFDDAKSQAIKLSKKYNYKFIPPFDHPLIISGQGTVAMELIQQEINLDRVFVPVGGGGLIAGIAILIKQLIPQIKIIAVEAEDSACLKAAIRAGKPINLPYVDLFADGVAVKRIGDETFRICNLYVDDIISVTNDSICSAIKDIFEDIRAIAEPAGALALAGIKEYIKKYNIKNEKLAYILSGANVNFHGLKYVSERCELGEKKESLLAVKIPEKKGSFLKFCSLLKGYIITEFNYRYSEKYYAKIFFGIKSSGLKEKQKIIKLIKNYGYEIIDLSENETAKLHLRYMIEGKIKKNIYEKIYSFSFPESEGALLNFLKYLENTWNITLFHYRSYRADYARVLVGFDMKKNKNINLEKHLSKLRYEYYDETLNPIFSFFN